MIDSMASASPMFFKSPGRLPFAVGACTTWPAALIDSATDSSSSPVCQAPCTSTYGLRFSLLACGEIQPWAPSSPATDSLSDAGHTRTDFFKCHVALSEIYRAATMLEHVFDFRALRSRVNRHCNCAG